MTDLCKYTGTVPVLKPNGVLLELVVTGLQAIMLGEAIAYHRVDPAGQFTLHPVWPYGYAIEASSVYDNPVGKPGELNGRLGEPTGSAWAMTWRNSAALGITRAEFSAYAAASSARAKAGSTASAHDASVAHNKRRRSLIAWAISNPEKKVPTSWVISAR